MNKEKDTCSMEQKINHLAHNNSTFRALINTFEIVESQELDAKNGDAGWQFLLADSDTLQNEFPFYMAGNLEQGVGYKDTNAFQNTDEEICYISEYMYSDYEYEVGELLTQYQHNFIDLYSFAEQMKEIAEMNGENKSDFLAITGGNQKEAEELFDSVDWQSPSTLYDEWVRDGEVER